MSDRVERLNARAAATAIQGQDAIIRELQAQVTRLEAEVMMLKAAESKRVAKEFELQAAAMGSGSTSE